MTRKTLRSHPRLWRAQGSSTIQSRRCTRSTTFYGEPKREIYHSIQFKRCARSTTFHGEPKGTLSFNSTGVPGARPFMESPRDLCHSIPKVYQEHDLLWRAQEGDLPFNSIQKVCQEHGLSWRTQGRSVIQFNRCVRSTAFHGDPKGALSFNSEGVPGERASMEIPRGNSTIQFNSKGVLGARPFIRGQWSSVIEFNRCSRNTVFLP